MRFAGLVLLSLILLVGEAAAAHSPLASNDSIVIDGKVIHVDAQVRFDSLPQQKTTPRYRPAWSADALVGMGGDWRQWSGQWDRAVEGEVQWLRRPLQQDFRSQSATWLTGSFGAMVSSLVGVNESTFPDSLIGFLPATPNAPLSFVTSQEFDIGTETDTLAAPTIRSASLAPYATLGIAVEKRNWSIRVAGGVQYSKPSVTSRPVLNAPSLEGPPLLPGEPTTGRLRARIEYSLGFRLDRTQVQLRLKGVLLPGMPQNHWVGLGVMYFTD